MGLQIHSVATLGVPVNTKTPQIKDVKQIEAGSSLAFCYLCVGETQGMTKSKT